MNEDNLRNLLALARVGYASRVENMSTKEMQECLNALIAGEADLIALIARSKVKNLEVMKKPENIQ